MGMIYYNYVAKRTN